jgi:hypothetical protein
MTHPGLFRPDEKIVGAMIQLASAAKSHRMIVAGSNSSEISLELHRRGYLRVTTTRTCRTPCGQHDVLWSPGGNTRSGLSKRRSTGSCTF